MINEVGFFRSSDISAAEPVYNDLELSKLFEVAPEQDEAAQIELVEVVTSLLLISKSQKELLKESILGKFSKETWLIFVEEIKASISHTEDKLATIGITMSQYLIIYQAAHQEGGSSIIEEIIGLSEDLIERGKVVTTLADIDKETMLKKHEEIVAKILERVPVSEKQKVDMVIGPFAGGKTEAVNNVLEKEDRLEIDLDQIRKILIEDYDPEDQRDIQRVREESWMLSDLLFKTALKTGRSVLIQTALHRRQRWMNDSNIALSAELDIPIEIHSVLRPFSNCLLRNMGREGRSVAIRDQYESMEGMAVLIDFMKKFQNIKKVVFLDFFPLIEKETGQKCKVSMKKYEALMSYARDEASAEMEFRRQEFDIEIIHE